MRTYFDFLDKTKFHLLFWTTIIVAILSISLKDLAFEGSYRIWFDKESHIIKEYDDFRSMFSGDDTFVVAFEDEKGIFNKKAIDVITNLTSEFEKLDGVQKVDSITNYQYISSQEDDIIVEDFIYDTTNLERKKEIALKDPLILNQLISKDGKTTMIALRLATLVGADEALNIKTMDSIEKITKEYKKKSGYHFYISGIPAVTASLVSVSQKDAMILMPLAVIIVVSMLFLLFRSVMGVLIPSVVIVFTFLLVLSMQMILGYKLNNFTVNIPAFITAIAIADSMHLYLAWHFYKLKGMKNKEAVYEALSTNFLPIAMTSFTTAVGFASLGLSQIVPISTLGVAISSGALIAFLLSVSIAPAILLMLKDSYEVKSVKFLDFSNIKGYGAFITRNDKKIIFISLALFAVIGYGLNFIKIDSNSIKYFKKDTTVRSGSDFIEDKISGPMLYEIIIDSKKKDGVKNPAYLNKIVEFEKKLKENFKSVRFSTSLKDIIVRMQKVLNPDSNSSLPQNQNLAAQYLLLYSMSLAQGNEISDKIDIDEQRLRLTINCDIQDTSKDLKMIRWIEDWWEDNSSYSAKVQGQTTIFAYMQDSITDTLIISISITLLIVVIAMFLIFRDIKMLWIFIVPNIAPIILVAGVMGYLGITIDIGVAVFASVVLGIAVDDTIHFFSKYFTAIKTLSFEDSIEYVLKHSGGAMILTTFILSATFSIFGVSSFVPNINFAIVTVVALNIALLLDLILLPALLSLLRSN
jgi:predicted RND superfamily exporter protein